LDRKSSKQAFAKIATPREQFAYSDTWADGTTSYLAMITPRLILMRELLSDTGSIYVHLDWHVGHYVKLVMDEVFGKENLVNEIIWRSANAHNDSNRYGSIHSSIYFYQKTSSRIWNGAYRPYDDPDKTFKHRDDKGRYQDVDLTAPGGRGPRYIWKGVERNWLVTENNMKKLEEENRLHYSSSGLVRRKLYELESKGSSVQSIWDDIGTGAEGRSAGSGYDTAKPPSLLERIIKFFSKSKQSSCRLLRWLRHYRSRRRKIRPQLDHHRPRQTRLYDYA
jgi:adenine-specific DNA-methyltransferase